MIQLQCSVDFTFYGACKSVFLKALDRLKLRFLVLIQCFTLCTTARNHCAMFVFFSFFYLCPTTALLHQSLKSSTCPGNRFPLGNYHHISFIRAIKSSVLTMLIQKICHNTVLHSLHYSQEPLRHVCFLQFFLSLSDHCTFTSVFEIFNLPW